MSFAIITPVVVSLRPWRAGWDDQAMWEREALHHGKEKKGHVEGFVNVMPGCWGRDLPIPRVEFSLEFRGGRVLEGDGT